MAQQGRAGEALTAAFTSSFVGALFAVIMITLVAPLVAKFALQFGPPEKFAVYFLAFCSFIGMSKEPPFKTVASMMIGFALAAVGLDSVTGQLRLTFGSDRAAQRLRFPDRRDRPVRHRRNPADHGGRPDFKGGAAGINPKVVLQTWAELPRYWMTSLRSCVIGCWMGIVPAGATPASFMSYGIAKRVSKHGDKFGKRRDRGRGRAGNGCARRRHRGAAADALARRAGLADRGGAARRPADLGPAAGTAAVRRAEGFRLGPDRRRCISAMLSGSSWC